MTLQRAPMKRRHGKRRAAQRVVTSLAKGRDCTIRSPVCNFDNTTTVPCHVPDQCDSGTGHIAPALFVAWGCHACHAITTTGEYQGVRLEPDDRERLLLRGMRRTQSTLLREGVIAI